MQEQVKNETQQQYSDKIPYSMELIKRISAILDASQYQRTAFEEINSLHAILLPEIKESIKIEIEVLRKEFNRLKSRLPYPVLTIPTEQNRPRVYDMFAPRTSPNENKNLYWSDFPLIVRDNLHLYFQPGQVLNTTDVLRLVHYEYARKEIEIVIRELHKHNLLLYSDKIIETGRL